MCVTDALLGGAVKEHVDHLDLTALLVEAQSALDAIRHGSTGLRCDVDPLQEAQRLADAWKAIYELAEQAYPGARTRERSPQD